MIREDLLPLWESVENRRWRLMEAVGRMPSETQEQSIRGGWSPLDQLRHLTRAEEVALGEIGQAGEATGSPKQTLGFRFIVWGLRRMSNLPAPATMEPQGTASLEEIGRHWEALRGRLRQALESESDSRPFSKHPIFGAMSADMVLELLDAHLEYHQRKLGAG